MSDITENDFEETRQEFDPLIADPPTPDPRGKARLKKKPGRPRKGTMAPGTYQTIWAPQRREDGSPGPQYALLSCPFNEIFFGGARGGGKGSHMDSLIMTPFGWRKMGEMRLGQAVCNPDGSVCHIIGIYPLGERQLYRVTFHDGTSTEVTDDHIWLTWKSNKAQKSAGIRQFGEQSARLWTTASMMEDMKTERKTAQNFLIPVTQPVVITDVSRHPRRPIPPYVLGALLGDGSLGRGGVVLSCNDPETALRVRHLLEDDGGALHEHSRYGEKCLSYRVSNGEVTRHLDKWGLIGKDSFTKFIPEPYLLGNIEERWELLRGLMDTDGWADQDGDIYYATSGPDLRDGVATLARSLGGVVTLREKSPTYHYKGEKMQGSQSWTLRLKFRDNSMAFHMERKKALCSRVPQSMSRTIVSIEPSRMAESQCIQVSHPNGLYLTNDYIVTHNTDGAIGVWLEHASRYGQHARGMFLRRQYKALEEVQQRCSMLFPKIGATFHKGEAAWAFPNGAVLKLGHLWDEAATNAYLGHQYTMLLFEEITQYPTPTPIDMMRGTLRSAHGVPTKLIMTGNPGGAGHGWVRERYVSPAPQGYTPIADPKTGAIRIYIPSRVTDNIVLMKNDPNYINNLKQAGSENLVKAWLEGDWNIVAGGYFSDIIDPDVHYLKPFDIPDTWRYRRSFDWGSAAPAALGIWAISDGNPVPDLDGFVFPRGSLILVKEWYTVDRKDDGTLIPNQGQRLTNLALGNGIAQRSMRYNFSGCVADPSIFAKPGRESIYDEMRKGALEAGHNLVFSPADNNRVAGWQRMRDMLQNARDLRPEKEGMWIFETCHHWIRTVPVLQRDERNPDDIDTGSEDHLADSSRYIAQTGVRSMVVGDLTGR